MRWTILAVVLLVALMALVKLGATQAVTSWGAWIAIPVVAVLILVGHMIDRGDRRKKLNGQR